MLGKLPELHATPSPGLVEGGLRKPDGSPGRWLAALLVLALAAPLAAARSPVPVSTEKLADRLIYPTEDAPATVVSLNDSLIAAEIDGRVAALAVRVGDRVPAGALLARLDCRDAELEAERARAALTELSAAAEFAAFQLTRAEALARARNISEELLNQRQTEARSATAREEQGRTALALARRQVEKCELRAPFAALVRERLTGLGEWRRVGEPLLRLVDLEAIEVSARVATRSMESLAQARTLEFVTGDGVFPLRLRSALPAVDTHSDSREVRLDFTSRAALPGSPGRLRWRTHLPHLPPDLLVRREGLGVFLLEDDRAVFHPLPAATEGRPAAVDLPPGTPLIVRGRDALRDGDPVAPAR